MVNILLSDFSICHENAYEVLKEYFKPLSKVLVIPYANWEYLQDEEHFEELFDYNNGREFNDIANKLHMYGIQKEDIWVISPKDSVEFILEKIKRADIVLLTGGDPNQIAKHMPFEVWEALDDVKILAGVSAGSMIQCAIYYMCKGYEDDCVPLVKRDSYPFGMTYCFDIIMVHYDENNEIQRQAIARHSGRKYSDLILLKDGEGLVYDDYILTKVF
jgi:hypothetical protein